MKIALDFDGTFTADPSFWQSFIGAAVNMGHEVRIVTARDEINDGINWAALCVPTAPCKVVWCDGRPKRELCRAIGWEPDVWIDDNPATIILPTAFKSEEDLLAWRLTDELGTRQKPIHGRSRGFKQQEQNNGGASQPPSGARLQQRRNP